jgi:two-component system, sensor histidine kinase and response regulator
MAGAEKPTILLVDDDPANLDFLERVFRTEYRLLRANDGQEALEILTKEKKVSVIVTDQRMPRVSGTQLLEKSLAIDPKIVKIILSGYTDTADILSAINVCRINHYLVKPVTAEKLRTVVATALQLVPAAERYGR